jgi:hypothetical protein
MDVIDGEEIHILHMPSEGSTPHAKVQIWRINTGDLGVIPKKT